MGTDIHPALEVRRNGVWRYHQPKTLCKWYSEIWSDPVEVDAVNKRISAYAKERKGRPAIVKVGDRKHPWDRCKYRLPDYFSGRNYTKFAILGNVRNGSGFAGIRTGDPIEPISDYRGFPPDMDPKTMGHMSNDHSETWVSLQEMLDYNVMLPQLHAGIIDEAEFIRCLIEKRTPSHWSGDITGPGIVKVTPEQYANLFGTTPTAWGTDPKTRTYDPNARYHIIYEWYTHLADSVPEWEDMIKYMLAIVPKGGTPEDVRMVMDFDS